MDFDFKTKMKKQSVTNDIKKIFESNLYLHKENTEIEALPTLKETIEVKWTNLTSAFWKNKLM